MRFFLALPVAFLVTTTPASAQSVYEAGVEQSTRVQYVPWNNDPILSPGLYYACDNGNYLVS